MASAVVIDPSARVDEFDDLAKRASEAGDDVSRAIELAIEIGADTALPGGGHTAQRWQTLATLGAADLTTARAVEPHLDALAILDEARSGGIPVDLGAVGADAGSSWGVFAAEGPGGRLTATRDGSGWVLSGHKPWCSLADRLSHALVTAHTPDGRALFAVALRDNGVTVEPGTWVARGLTNVHSGPVTMSGSVAVPVGAALWYLERPGFAWGGIGVAAVWWGGAVALARSLYSHAAARPEDALRAMHLGAVDLQMHAAATTLADSAGQIDAGTIGAAAAPLLASRVRGVVAAATEQVLTRVGHALGPAPLALDAEHARRVADLQLYLRQHHAERDEAALGTSLVQSGVAPW